MKWAIRKWALYADAVDGSLSINEDMEEGEIPTDDFKFCPWCAKPVPRIEKVEWK